MAEFKPNKKQLNAFIVIFVAWGLGSLKVESSISADYFLTYFIPLTIGALAASFIAYYYFQNKE